MLQKAYSDSSVQNYYSDYSKFIDQSQIKQDLQESQGFILEQLDELNSLIKKNPSIIDTFKKQFAGTRYAGS